MEMKNLVKKTGTTTVGIVCKDGVVVAAEKKATMGHLVASKEAKKIFALNDRIMLTTAGLSADNDSLVRVLRAEIKLYELQHKKRISVGAAATLLSNILYSGRWTFIPYMVQLIIAGIDEKPRLYDLDAYGAKEEQTTFFATGSGSPFALGVLEAGYSKDISVKEAEELAIKAIKSAVERDIGSGGNAIDIGIVTERGIEIKTIPLQK